MRKMKALKKYVDGKISKKKFASLFDSKEEMTRFLDRAGDFEKVVEGEKPIDDFISEFENKEELDEFLSSSSKDWKRLKDASDEEIAEYINEMSPENRALFFMNLKSNAAAISGIPS